MNYNDKQIGKGTRLQMDLNWNCTMDKAMDQKLVSHPFPVRSQQWSSEALKDVGTWTEEEFVDTQRDLRFGEKRTVSLAPRDAMNSTLIMELAVDLDTKGTLADLPPSCEYLFKKITLYKGKVPI